MKQTAISLILATFLLCFVACQSESPAATPIKFEPPPVTLESGGNPPGGQNEEAQAPAATSKVDDEIIGETQHTIGADTPTQTPQFTPTPTINLTDEAPGSGAAGGGGASGGNGGANESKPYPETTINTGAYEGAILETQFGIGGGGGDEFPLFCLSSNGLSSANNMTTNDEFLGAGCLSFDGFPVIVIDLGYSGPRHSSPGNKIIPMLNTWNDDFLRHVFYRFESYENIRVLFYATSGDFNDLGTLYGWQDVQVDANGTYLLKTRIPIPSDNLRIVVQRTDGSLLAEEGQDVVPLADPALDSDGDGLGDNDEGLYHHTDPYNPDSDNDGLSDGEELSVLYTDPNNPDSDGDGRSDGEEVSLGSDPTNSMNVDDITQVSYQGGGQFVQQAGTEWIEYNNDGQFFYQENGRDPWSIYLYDASRDLSIQLDLWTREVKCSGQNCNGVLYLIEGVSR